MIWYYVKAGLPTAVREMNPRSRESDSGNRAYIIYYASQINEDLYIILTGQLYTDQSSLSSGNLSKPL